MPYDLVMKKKHERRFLEQLFDSKSLEEFPLPVTIKTELRGYQQVIKTTIIWCLSSGSFFRMVSNGWRF